jgi:hypothetical protein
MSHMRRPPKDERHGCALNCVSAAGTYCYSEACSMFMLYDLCLDIRLMFAGLWSWGTATGRRVMILPGLYITCRRHVRSDGQVS